MPRAGWVALGAIGTALLAVDLGPLAQLTGLGACLFGLAVALLLHARPRAATAPARTPTPARPTGRTRPTAAVAFAAAGGALLLARLTLGAVLAGPPAVTSPPEGRGPWTAQVESLSSPSDGYQRALLGLTGEAGAAVLLYARLPGYPTVVPGDRVTVRGRVELVPEGPGFGDYLRRVGAAGTLEATSLELAAPADGPAGWLERRRRDAADLLARALPAPQAGFATAMLIGLRDRVDRDVADAFTAAGLSHVIAISGWNIALVAGTIAGALGFLSRRSRSVVTLLAIAVYTLVAGAGPSVVRAAVMAALALTARISGRGSQARALLALAATAMLLVDPAVAADPGFQLSVAATAGLLVWGTPLSTWLREHVLADTPDGLVTSLGVSLAAQAATLPLVLLDFGRLSLIAPVANLLAAPLVPPAMLTGAIALAAAWFASLGVPDVVRALGAAPGGVVVGMLLAVADIASRVPGASIGLDPTASLLAASVSITGIVLFSRPGLRRGLAFVVTGRPSGPPGQIAPHATDRARPRSADSPRRRRAGAAHRATRLALGALFAAAVALILVAAGRPDGRFRLTVLDVGQGDAILVEGPRGGRLLVDTGPDPERLLVQLDARIPTWDRRLDVVVLTHPHDDHIAGAALLLDRYRVGRVFDSGMPGSGPGYAALRAELAHLGQSDERLAAGDRLTLDGAVMEVRWPAAGQVPATADDDGTVVNDASIVLDVRYGERRFLLTGDAEEAVDAQLIAGGLAADGGRVDVLKVAHHGSPTSTTAALLDAIRPRVAAISVGAGNTYGHPGPDTLARLLKRGIRTYRTDLHGSVAFSTDGHDLRVETARDRPFAWSTGRGSMAATQPVAASSISLRTPRARVTPRISGWPFLLAWMLHGFSSASTRPPGTSPMSAPLPRSPPSLPSRPSVGASTWTGRWSRPRRSCTTSTSSSPKTTRSWSWGTARQVRAG